MEFDRACSAAPNSLPGQITVTDARCGEKEIVGRGRRGVGDEKLCLNVATICLYNVGGTEKQFIEAIAIIN